MKITYKLDWIAQITITRNKYRLNSSKAREVNKGSLNIK